MWKRINEREKERERKIGDKRNEKLARGVCAHPRFG